MEPSEEKMSLQQFSEIIDRLMPSKVVTELETHVLYWTLYIKYKNKLKVKRFLEEYEIITRSWVGCQEIGSQNNYLNIYFMFLTKDGRLRGKGTGNGGPFTVEGQRKGKKVQILLKNVENAGRWNMEGAMQDNNHRIDVQMMSSYFYVLPEGSTKM